jgi:hypothetical protein
LLKEKRLGKDAKLTGANLRSAWAFTLWGDPTLKLPAPRPPAEALPAIRPEVHGNTIVIQLPETAYDPVKAGRYESRMWPNARLAGLLTKGGSDDQKKMVPFVFVEVALPKAPPHQQPKLQSKLPESRWVFCWDQRRRCGHLLVEPRPRDPQELRFHVDWEPTEAAPILETTNAGR